jgi:predicted amidohydrolase YtcJ
MIQRMWRACVVAGAMTAVAPSFADEKPQPADTVLTGGRVWTADPAQPWAEAVAVSGDRIAYVGSAAGAKAYVGPGTKTVELAGRLVTPGFNDGHLHLMSGALSLERVDLIEEQDTAAVQAKIKAFAAPNPKNGWVLGRGWLYGSFAGGLPTKEQLDAVVSDRPAYMECYDGHSGWANSKALALAGITKDTPNPPRGEIVKDPRTGEPTGALKESATSLVEAKIPPATAEQRYAALLRALKLLNSQGLTAAQDAGYGPDEIAGEMRLWQRARGEGALTLRFKASVRMSPAAGGVEEAVAEASRLAALPKDPYLRFGTVKGFVDGVVEAHTAAMLAPYSDDPKFGAGEANWEPAALNAAVAAADKAGLQVYLHAIGDRGVRMALDAHEAAARANGPRDRRGRIEHIETIDPADYPRFKALGVIASMQPLHANPDLNNSDVWSRNAGPDRAGRGFSWGNVQRAGGRLVFGSDWPVVTSDVFRGLYVAVTRKTREGTPPGGWLPEQAVTLEEALRHYTIDGAYGAFEEGERGSLTAGKWADLVVLSNDLFKVPPEQILTTKVLLTMLGGRTVHRDGI